MFDMAKWNEAIGRKIGWSPLDKGLTIANVYHGAWNWPCEWRWPGHSVLTVWLAACPGARLR